MDLESAGFRAVASMTGGDAQVERCGAPQARGGAGVDRSGLVTDDDDDDDDDDATDDDDDPTAP
jgi:hypothetical protein